MQDPQQLIEQMIGQYGWMLIAGFVLLIGRKAIESAISSFQVFVGDDLNTDDVVLLSTDMSTPRPARVVRCGIFKTIFFVYDIGCADGKPFVKGGTKMAIQNDKLKDYIIEKPLPMLDLSRWENCDD